MKRTRPHSNTKGTRQIRRGKTYDQVKAMAKRLGLPFAGVIRVSESEFDAFRRSLDDGKPNARLRALMRSTPPWAKK